MLIKRGPSLKSPGAEAHRSRARLANLRRPLGAPWIFLQQTGRIPSGTRGLKAAMAKVRSLTTLIRLGPEDCQSRRETYPTCVPAWRYYSHGDGLTSNATIHRSTCPPRRRSTSCYCPFLKIQSKSYRGNRYRSMETYSARAVSISRFGCYIWRDFFGGCSSLSNLVQHITLARECRRVRKSETHWDGKPRDTQPPVRVPKISTTHWALFHKAR
jgi:hypothetical protein